jgi:hypothetical protein
VPAQQKNTANDCEKLSGLDPNPIRRATVTEMSNKTAATHGQIKAGGQDYGERNPLTEYSLADSLDHVLVHRSLNALAMRADLMAVLREHIEKRGWTQICSRSGPLCARVTGAAIDRPLPERNALPRFLATAVVEECLARQEQSLPRNWLDAQGRF